MRRDGTSEVIAALRSVDMPQRPEPYPARSIEASEAGRGLPMIVNDFGPKLGAPRLVSLETPKRRYVLYECVDGVQSVLRSGSRRCDLVLWVQSCERDVEPVASDGMLSAARFLGADRALVFLTDTELASDARADRVEYEVRTTLERAGFSADECPVVRSSGAIDARAGDRWREATLALRELIDDAAPYVDADDASGLVVDDVFSIARRGTVATGQVAVGAFRVGDRCELVTTRGRRETKIVGLEMFNRPIDLARRSDFVGVLLGGLSRDDVQRGDLLVSPGYGAIVRRARARGFSWSEQPVDARAAALALDDLSASRPGAIRPSSDPWIQPGAFDVELAFESSIPLLADRPLYLRGGAPDRSVFATIIIDEVLSG